MRVSKLTSTTPDRVEGEEEQRDQQAAGHRVGDVEARAAAATRRVDRLAEQVGDEAEGDGHEVGEVDLGHVAVTRYCAPSWRQR